MRNRHRRSQSQPEEFARIMAAVLSSFVFLLFCVPLPAEGRCTKCVESEGQRVLTAGEMGLRSRP